MHRTGVVDVVPDLQYITYELIVLRIMVGDSKYSYVSARRNDSVCNILSPGAIYGVLEDG